MKSFVPHGLRRLDNIRGDIYGGLTAAVVALPLAIAFGVASGAGPVAGLYGAIFVGLFAALFGGTPSQVSGPTGPMTVVMTGILVQFTAADPVNGAAMAFTVVMMGGFFLILLGVFGLGRYISLVPHPVISGFMSGIGVIIILLQIGPLLGHKATGSPLESLRMLPEMIKDINPYSISLGFFTIIIVYLLPSRINRIIPAPLLALFAGTAALLLFLPEGSVTTIGEIPSSIPMPDMPVFSLRMFPNMVKSALILALLGSIDSLLTSLVADNITRTHHDSNRELIGQGIGNIVAGLFGGLPGAGATMRTVVNIRAGGKTPISGALHALVLLSVVLGAGKYAKYIPHVVLTGILIKVGTDIIDWSFFRRLHRTPRTAVLLMFTVLFITVFVDLITSVAVGLVAASLLLVQRMADLQLKSIQAITEPGDESPLCEEAMSILRAAKGRILLYHLSGPLSFGAAKDMAQRLNMIDDYEVMILDMSNVPTIDFTTSVSIEDMIRGAQAEGHHVLLSGAQPVVRDILARRGVFELLGKENDFHRRLHAIRKAANLSGIEVGEASK
ncbi:MAG TPA: SulP family inorganic anion transporter [Nitrospirae bacterium]|nr:SulP family inorganic anion transporter [Nitrospirota bacterium]